MKHINIFGFTVFSDSLEKIDLSTGKTRVLSTISPNSYGISTKDHLFKEALKECDYLVLDGVYFALASIFLQRRNIKKNQGPDVFYHFMSRMNRSTGKVFFLGSTKETLEKMKINALIDYPNILIDYYSPPFKSKFTEDENSKMVEAINLFSPDILFVGMTCPKQEKWSFQNKKKLKTNLICGIGAVFDWYAGNYEEIKPIWWKLRLGWLIRAIQRPEVLSRNIPNYYIFFKDLFLSIIRIKSF